MSFIPFDDDFWARHANDAAPPPVSGSLMGFRGLDSPSAVQPSFYPAPFDLPQQADERFGAAMQATADCDRLLGAVLDGPSAPAWGDGTEDGNDWLRSVLDGMSPAGREQARPLLQFAGGTADAQDKLAQRLDFLDQARGGLDPMRERVLAAASQVEDPARRGLLTEAFRQAVEARRAHQVIGDEAAASQLDGLALDLEESDAQQLLARDPDGLLQRLAEGGFGRLGEERRAALGSEACDRLKLDRLEQRRAQAQEEQRAILGAAAAESETSHLVATAIDDLQGGVVPAELPRLMSAAKPAERAQLEAGLKALDLAEGRMGQLPPSAQDAEHERLRAAGDFAGEEGRALEGAINALRARTRDALARDPFAFAARTGLIAPGPVDFADRQGLAERRRQAEMVRLHYGAEARVLPFSQPELGALSESLRRPGAEARMQVLDALAAGLGAEQRAAVMQALAPRQPVIAAAGMMAGERSVFARELLEASESGAQLVALPPQPVAAAIVGAVDRALAGDPAWADPVQRQAAGRAALTLFAVRAGGDPTGGAARSIAGMAQALHDVAEPPVAKSSDMGKPTSETSPAPALFVGPEPALQPGQPGQVLPQPAPQQPSPPAPRMPPLVPPLRLPAPVWGIAGWAGLLIGLVEIADYFGVRGDGRPHYPSAQPDAQPDAEPLPGVPSEMQPPEPSPGETAPLVPPGPTDVPPEMQPLPGVPSEMETPDVPAPAGPGEAGGTAPEIVQPQDPAAPAPQATVPQPGQASPEIVPPGPTDTPPEEEAPGVPSPTQPGSPNTAAPTDPRPSTGRPSEFDAQQKPAEDGSSPASIEPKNEPPAGESKTDPVLMPAPKKPSDSSAPQPQQAGASGQRWRRQPTGNPIADRIADGHGFDEHREELGKIGIHSRDEYAARIDSITKNAREEDKRELDRDRHAWWDSSGSGLVVIHDPWHPDGGTAFVPTRGRKYFENMD